MRPLFSRIHHIAVICSDKEKALDFYVNRLGLELIRESFREDRGDWKIDLLVAGAADSSEHTELELFIIPSAPRRLSYPEAQGLRHLAFRVDSVPETAARLKEKGIDCEPVRKDTFTGGLMTFFHDPDGLPIEIHE